MVNYERLEKELITIYGRDKIHIYPSKQIDDIEIRCNISKKENFKKDLLICVKNNYAVIFDNRIRKQNNMIANSNRISNLKWNDLYKQVDSIRDYYRLIGKKGCQQYYHKILVMTLETLYDSRYELYGLIDFSSDDIEIPLTYKNKIDNNYKRKIITSTSKSRYYKFRKLVLERYNYQCAICRCKEEELLQAAHIKAVSLDGDDNPKNGICLCANHHLMFDRKLINIDFKNMKVIVNKKSIMEMPWYDCFIEKYKGIVLSPFDRE